MPDNTILKAVSACVVNGDPDAAAAEIQAALDAGLDPQIILDDGLMSGAAIVGELFESGEAFLPDLILAGKALKAAVTVLKPKLALHQSGLTNIGRVVIATVQTDIHDIGKNIVSSMLTAAGFEVDDLGVDVPIRAIIDRAEETHADIIACSVLLTTSMPYLRDLTRLLQARNLRDKYRVIIGGASVTEDFARDIGADGTAPDAMQAVQLVRELMAKKTDSV